MLDKARAKKATLLIADDDAELCQLYGRFPSDRGFEVATCTDGLGCLLQLHQRPPAVLVLDLALRWGGGDGILAWLREQSEVPLPSVVLVAGGASPTSLPEMVIPPVQVCLRMPLSLSALLESARAAATSRQAALGTGNGSSVSLGASL
jgi:DNA-binding response OmpR family regulator